MGDNLDAIRGEVMRLHYLEGLSLRAIARRLRLSRRTVRRHLGRMPVRPQASTEPRPSLLARFDAKIRELLDATPELRAPQILERLRPLGYTGGISILRDRIKKLRPAT